jgi:hypothetical protein
LLWKRAVHTLSAPRDRRQADATFPSSRLTLPSICATTLLRAGEIKRQD